MYRCDLCDFDNMITTYLLTYCRLEACIQVLLDVAESGWSRGLYIRYVHNELADCTHHNGRHRRLLLLRTLSQARSTITSAIFGKFSFHRYLFVNRITQNVLDVGFRAASNNDMGFGAAIRPDSFVNSNAV